MLADLPVTSNDCERRGEHRRNVCSVAGETIKRCNYEGVDVYHDDRPRWVGMLHSAVIRLAARVRQRARAGHGAA